MLARIRTVLVLLGAMLLLPVIPAIAGPQDDPPPVAITPGNGSVLPKSVYSLTLSIDGAASSRALEPGQVGQARAAAVSASDQTQSGQGAGASSGGASSGGGSGGSMAGAEGEGANAAGGGGGSGGGGSGAVVGECGFRAASVPAADARWSGNDPAGGALLMNTCNGPAQYVYVPNPAQVAAPGAAAPAAPPPPPPPPPDPAVLAQQAYGELDLPRPEAQRSPDASNSDPDHGGLPYTWVGLNTWVWVDNWQPLQRTVNLRGVSATVTATPKSLTFDPGNGDAPISCPGPGRPWTDADGNETPTGGGCAYKYRAVTPEGPLTADTGITWSVAWTSNTGAGGTFPAISTATTSSSLVEQIQVVVRR